MCSILLITCSSTMKDILTQHNTLTDNSGCNRVCKQIFSLLLLHISQIPQAENSVHITEYISSESLEFTIAYLQCPWRNLRSRSVRISSALEMMRSSTSTVAPESIHTPSHTSLCCRFNCKWRELPFLPSLHSCTPPILTK